MNNLITIIGSLIVSIALFYLGYNLIKNTQKTINLFNKYSSVPKKNFDFNKIFLGNNEIVWMKIVGYGVLVFALITFIAMVVLILKKVF